MGGSSDRYVYNGETPQKSSHAVATKAKKSSSKKSLSRNAVKSYLKNGEEDPVNALALGSGSSSKRTANRQDKVNREVAAALEQLNGASS